MLGLFLEGKGYPLPQHSPTKGCVAKTSGSLVELAKIPSAEAPNPPSP